MGWFWDSKPSNDPKTKLDPQLREYLNEESALAKDNASTSSTTTSASSKPAQSYRAQLGWADETTPSKPQPTSQDGRPIPEESLYQDGRYAHLWANYRPQHEVESASRSEQDKMADLIASYKDRRAAVGRAAVENCVLEQMAERACWETGTMWDRMNLCTEENRGFLRCYTMQSRFLKALGYLNEMRSEEEEERIQMHADKLYHQMLDREKLRKEAKERGEEVPRLPPLINAEEMQSALGENSAWARNRRLAQEMGIPTKVSEMPKSKQREIRNSVQKLDEHEKELELQLAAAEERSLLEFGDKVKERHVAERAKRQERREQGKETIGDLVRRVSGF